MSRRILSDWRAAARAPSSACIRMSISLIVCAFLCTFVSMNTGAAEAATRTWNGPDGGAWSNSNHWLPIGPIDPGDDLVFTVADADESSVNDLAAAFALGGLTLEATHNITGNSLTLSTGITASAGSPFVDLTILLGSDQTWTTNGAEVRVGWVNLNGHTWTLEGSGVHFRPNFVSGAGAIDVAMGSSGALLLPSGNFTGQVAIYSGRVEASSEFSLGANDGTPENGTIVGAGGTLRFTNVATIPNEWLTVSGDGVAPGMAALDIVKDGGPVTISATVFLSGATRVSVTTTVGAAQTATFQQALLGSGTLVVDKTGTIVLGAASNALAGIGFTPASTGTVRIGVANALPATVALSLPAAGSRFDLNGFATTVRSLTGNGTVMLTSVFGSTLTVDNTADTVFNGAISGTGVNLVGALVKRGAGELALTNASTYTGTTIVEGGTLRVAHPSALGDANNGWQNATHVKTGARLMLDGVTVGAEMLDIGGVIGTPARLQVTPGTPSSWAGPVSIVGPTVLTGTGGANLTLSGGVFGTSVLDLQAPIALHVTTTNVGFDGDLLITGAAATVDDTTGAFSARTLTLAGGTLALNGGQGMLRALSGTGTLALGINGSLYLDNTAPVSFGGSITGQGILTKSGVADLTLTGANPFGGFLRIYEGRLIVAHAQAHAAAELLVDDGAGVEYQTAASSTRGATLTGSGPGNAGTLHVLGGDVTFGGLVTLQGQTLLKVLPARMLTMVAVTSASALRFGGGGTMVIGSSGTDLTSVVFGADGLAPGTLRMGGPGALQPQVVDVPAGGTLDLAGFQLQLTGISGAGHIAIGSGTLMLLEAAADVAFGGTLSGTGHFVVDIGPHAFRLSGTHTFSGLFQTEGGPFFHRGVLPAAIMTDEADITFEGDSVVGDLLLQGGTVVVGDGVTPATVRATALSLMFSTLKLWIHMPAQGTATAPFTVAGSVGLQGTTLELAFTGIAPTESSPVTLIDNTGSALVLGEFLDLPDGALVDVGNGVSLMLRYAGGNGNDVTLGAPIATSYLAEGATGTFFDTDLLIANPHAVAVTATITFLPQDAPAQTITRAIEPMTRVTISVDEIPGLESVALSTVVASHATTPLVVERTMTWDASAYGAHTEKATAGAARGWIFAEGSEGGADGFFRTFILLANPDTAPNVATVEYLREGESPLVRTYDLPPLSRVTVTAADDPELVGRSFGTSVVFDRPGVAERAMYFGTNPIWTGGHGSAGATRLSDVWFLAEGATGDGFDTFILVANPFAVETEVQFTFFSENGEPATLEKTVPAKSRLTVNIEADMPGLPLGPVATQVLSTLPVVAERAQYWPLTPDRWVEAHNSFGVTEPAMKWGLAEGRSGGAEGYQTFILLANPGDEPATVTLAFLADGASLAPVNRTIVVPAERRVTVPAEAPEPSSTVTTFGTLLTADQPIVVERAMYWNADGQVWAAGTNATATRLP
jgi:autotransporter-associated beta strand protein